MSHNPWLLQRAKVVASFQSTRFPEATVRENKIQHVHPWKIASQIFLNSI